MFERSLLAFLLFCVFQGFWVSWEHVPGLQQTADVLLYNRQSTSLESGAVWSEATI